MGWHMGWHSMELTVQACPTRQTYFERRVQNAIVLAIFNQPCSLYSPKICVRKTWHMRWNFVYYHRQLFRVPKRKDAILGGLRYAQNMVWHLVAEKSLLKWSFCAQIQHLCCRRKIICQLRATYKEKFIKKSHKQRKNTTTTPESLFKAES